MRVIAGIARGCKLNTISGYKTRPTTDRLKESLFNIINNEIQGSIFLDLFSGSGAIGIEALSRGASKCYFVDNSSECINIIKKNLVKTTLISKGIVIKSNCIDFLCKPNEQFNIIFMDPPYEYKEVETILIKVKKTLSNKGFIIVEQSSMSKLPTIDDFSIFKLKKYKTTTFVFLEKNKEFNKI